MKKPWFAPATFMIVFCCAYAVAFAANLPLFLYYPLHDDFSWGPRVVGGIGPAIVWSGLLADAFIVALAAALVFPDRAAQSVFRNYLWVFPCGTMLVCIFLLRQLFK